MGEAVQTFKFRLRDKHASELNRQAKAVNFVWNYANETQRKAARDGRRWLSAFDLDRLTAGAGALLGVSWSAVSGAVHQYDKSRRQQRKPWLRWRSKKSLGWVPFRGSAIRIISPGSIRFAGRVYETMHWRDIPEDAKLCDSSFNADARGRWYLNLMVKVPAAVVAPCGPSPVGIDLGLKDLATLSTGEKIDAPRHYRQLETAFGMAQRANKRRRKQAISAKIANTRKDHLHKASARIALNHSLIAVGDVSSSKLAKTTMAKSVLDAGWHIFKRQLEYKALRHGSIYMEVDEAYTTQTCSSCGSLPPGRPKGIAGLGIRQWDCSDCGAVHDRDVNAAKNIAARGLASLAEGART